ncbi:assembly of actin patch protein [Marasmius tenuissimus]|uniref:Assembly of actin patch protein n=1 Tax=Marasmius tenuissimus TaxID=585030 RepID=A0ABR2ZL55_9AGAR
MSDPPPKPKPGSLRDRIAAFEKAPSSGSSPSGGAPPPRPKPGGLTWKPKPKEVTPPSSPGKDGEKEKAGGGVGGMSALDARQTIGIRCVIAIRVMIQRRSSIGQSGNNA